MRTVTHRKVKELVFSGFCMFKTFRKVRKLETLTERRHLGFLPSLMILTTNDLKGHPMALQRMECKLSYRFSKHWVSGDLQRVHRVGTCSGCAELGYMREWITHSSTCSFTFVDEFHVRRRKIQGSESSNHFYKVPSMETLQKNENKIATKGNATVRAQMPEGKKNLKPRVRKIGFKPI